MTIKATDFIWIYLLLINVYTLFLMYYDKRQAKNGAWRVPEKRLLLAGFLGGGPAGLIGQQLFHHKTRKGLFHVVFALGTVSFVALLYGYFRYFS